MKRIATLFAAIQLLLLGSPALAQMDGQTTATAHSGARTVAVQQWVEEWDAATGQWVRVAESASAAPTQTQAAVRYAQPVAPRPAARTLAQYGPFVVTSATTAQMIGSTDTQSPRHFDAMLRDFPELARLDMVEAPGTSNDIANLAIARRIRAEGIATHVPSNGSVRSGAVELFLSGATRTMEEGAQFAVHSWLDNHGREADDFAPDHPAHRLYIDFYMEMGMSEERARDFYDMTNSVPHHSALWLDAGEMRPWLRPERAPAQMPVFVAQPAQMAEAPVRAPVIALNIAPIAPVLHYSDLSAISLAALDLSRLDSQVAFS